MILWVLRRILLVIALILISTAFLAMVAPQGRVAVRTALFLPQILPGLPVKPQEWFTASPIRQEVHFPIASGEGLADLYLPGHGDNHSAVMMFLGVNPAGRDDERVVGLAEGLARAGTVVMIPWSETMTQKRIDAQEIDNLVMGFLYLRGLEIVDPERVGMGGFCVGASFAIVAAQDPRIRDNVSFVNFFGGYYNALDLVKSVVSTSRSYKGEIKAWNPDKLGAEVVASHLIHSILDPDERELLSQRFLQGIEAPIAVDTLSSDSAAVYRLLDGPSTHEADYLITQLSDQALVSLKRISPSTRINDLKARVLIMHDREDGLVPSEESKRLADALGLDKNTYYTEFSLFKHVDPTKSVSPPVYVREVFKMFLHMYHVISELS